MLLLLAGCCTRPPIASTPPADDPHRVQPAVVQPSALLRLAREERLGAEPPRLSTATAEVEDAEPVAPGHDETSSDADEVRRIVVKTHRFASWEDLTRYALRHVKKRRPREFHESRLLLRQSGPARVCGAGSCMSLRRRVHKLIRERRPALTRCLIRARARRGDMIATLPSSLVVEQALARGDAMVMRFAVRYEPGKSRPSIEGPQRQLDASARACLTEAMPPDLDSKRTHDVEIRLVAFAQASFGHGGSTGLNGALARQAAMLGWVHYERGDFEEALEYFRDAYWLFELVEYRLLEALAHDKLDQREQAVAAYTAYVDHRPHGLEAAMARRRIQALGGG